MNNFYLGKTLVPARWFFSFTILFSFQVGDSAFSWGLFFLYVHQAGQMSTMGLEVSPISPAGLHPCVLVMFALFQQRALVSHRVVWSMDGFANGQD